MKVASLTEVKVMASVMGMRAQDVAPEYNVVTASQFCLVNMFTPIYMCRFLVYILNIIYSKLFRFNSFFRISATFVV